MKIGKIRVHVKALRGPKNEDLREVDVALELSGEGETRVVRLIGGPTGYESFYVDTFTKSAREQGSFLWEACAGTLGRYDRLVVPRDQMLVAFRAFGIEAP